MDNRPATACSTRPRGVGDKGWSLDVARSRFVTAGLAAPLAPRVIVPTAVFAAYERPSRVATLLARSRHG
jgi:hypothetical protein